MVFFPEWVRVVAQDGLTRNRVMPIKTDHSVKTLLTASEQ